MALASLRVYRDAVEARSPRSTGSWTIPRRPRWPVIEVRDVQASKRLTASDDQIIVSASGMATGGRVVHHLARFLEEPTSSVVLVGYQAQGTRGQALLGGATQLKMLGRYVRVRAEIVNLPAFSVMLTRTSWWPGSGLPADRQRACSWSTGSSAGAHTGPPDRGRSWTGTPSCPQLDETVRL